jgi:dienelactone hydrolase
MMNGLISVRGDKPFILVTPITFSNTNALDKNKYPYPQSLLDDVEKSGRLKFDEEGLLAVLDDVHREFAGEEKFAITGFSGGGLLCWRMTFGHPEMLFASAPACANFYQAGEISKDPARETIPIHAFQGDKDEYLHNPPNLAIQWELARKLLDENGFRNVKYDMLAGVGHSGCSKEVMDHWAGNLRAPLKK